jgi:CSLREA domain-containing protein
MATLSWHGHGAVWLLAAIAGEASAFQSFTVTRFDDPAPNGCLVGDCSLREAVLAANALPGFDGVVLASGTYTVASTLLASGPVRIQGTGPASTRVLASSALEPLLQIDDSIPSTLSLQQLSIDAAGGFEVEGDAGTQLVLEFVHAPNPDARMFLRGTGGLVNVFDSDLAGLMAFQGPRFIAIEDSRFRRLTITQTSVASDPEAYLRRVVVDGIDRTDGQLHIGSVGEVRLFDVTVQNTRHGLVVVDAVPEELSIDRLRYLDNGAPLRVLTGADVTITNSEFRGNRPLLADLPGALLVEDADASVVVQESTFSGNTGTSDTGGAVLVESGGSLSLRNSTFAGNSFTVAAASAGARGGAVGYRSDPAITALTLQNVTILAPAFMPTGAQGSALAGRGAGSGVILSLYSTILDGSCRSDGAAPEFAIGNIKTSGDTCGLGGGNLVGVSRADIALGPLRDNGGATPTMVPAVGSVAIDGGNDLGCASIDQRGVGRPSGLRCDAGAIETGEVIFANGFN